MGNAQQALSAVAGGVIGFFIGGPAGAIAGLQYGLLAGALLFPTQLPGVQGPRLEDFETLHADPGAPVYVGWGTFVVPGFRMYLGEPKEIATTEEVGGKGGPSQEVTTYTYLQTLALGLCEGPIEGVRRIWENGELVYDAREQQESESTAEYDARIAKSAEYWQTLTLYLGTEDQTPDPTLELELGAGNVPAFRGLAYIVFPDRQLRADQANRHPAFKIEIAAAEKPVAKRTTRVVFTTVATPIVWVVPAGVTKIDMLLVGGGGGGTSQGVALARGGGGGGGVLTIFDVPVTPGSSITVNVGAGGQNELGGGPSAGQITTVVIGSTTYEAGGGGASDQLGTTRRDGWPENGNGCGGDSLFFSVFAPGTGKGDGHPGGAAWASETFNLNASGGGGGAGGPGEDAQPGVGGAGGPGLIPPHNLAQWGTDIGEGGYFGGGGGGRNIITAETWTNAPNGVGGGAPNTGGGGHAGEPGNPGVPGYSGIVVFIYETPEEES